MRIGMFCDMYKPYVSGVTIWIDTHKKRLEELGHEVFVFTFGDRDHVDDESGVVRSLGIGLGKTGANLGVAFSPEARHLIQTLDIAHAHHPFQSGRMALRECRKHRIPLVFTNHTRYDLYSDVYAPTVPRGIRRGSIDAYLRRFLPKVDLVISPSPSIAEWLKEQVHVEAHVEVLPNGVDTRPFSLPAQPLSKADLGFDTDTVLACFVGRLGEEKNLHVLLDSLIAIADQVPRLSFLFVGEGPLRNEMEQRLKAAGLSERTRFVGLVPYARIPDYLAACDLFATASVSEVHPLVVIEALAAGLPVVAFTSPGIVDTISDGRNGMLAPEGDIRGLEERLAILATDEALRSRLASNATVDAAGFDVTHTVDLLLEHYERLRSARSDRT